MSGRKKGNLIFEFAIGGCGDGFVMKINTTYLLGVMTIESMVFCASCVDNHASYCYEDWNTKLVEYHNSKFSNDEEKLKEELDVYVDYSTCMKQANDDPNGLFKQLLLSPILGAHPNYYSIKGNQIQQESEDPNILFRSIVETPYADLKGAIEKMASSNCESVLMTDGEYVLKETKANWNEGTPYMAEAMKKWLLRGHDIHILVEPYIESFKGKNYNKKRFYIFFTDRCLKNNVYSKIADRINKDNMKIDSYHISCSHVGLKKQNGTSSVASQMLAAKITPKESFEIQEWQVYWKTIEESMVYSSFDPITGAPMENSAQVISGLSLAEDCLLGFKIKDVDMKAYSISDEFSVFADSSLFKYIGEAFEVKDFVTLDSKELSQGNISVMFANQNQYNPLFMISSPYNYLRLDFYIGTAESTIDSYKNMFCFDDITKPEQPNTSVYESIKQCMDDADILSKVNGAHLYSIYVQSPNRE